MAKFKTEPPAAEVAPSTLCGPNEIQAEIARWSAEAEAAARDFADVQAAREAALLTATVNEIVAFDDRLARADARVDIAHARLGALQSQLGMAEAKEAEAKIGANRAEALGLAAQISNLLMVDYVAAAAAVAAILTKVKCLGGKVEAINNMLPQHLRVVTHDEKCSVTEARRHENAYGHIWYSRDTTYLTNRVALPNVDCGEDLWPRKELNL